MKLSSGILNCLLTGVIPLKHIFGEFVTAGDEKLVVDFQDNVFESSYGNAMLPCNYRVRYAARRQYGDVVFTQCEHE